MKQDGSTAFSAKRKLMKIKLRRRILIGRRLDLFDRRRLRLEPWEADMSDAETLGAL